MSRASFESRYRAAPDPWGTETDPRERAKAADALRACGPGPFARACELGAGVGVLTAALAPRCDALLALDAAPTAVARATVRLAPWPRALALVARIPRDLPPGPFDLVVASEVLYYLDDEDFARTLGWLTPALARGGRVVTVHWRGSAPDLRRTADEVGAALHGLPGLRTIEAARRPTYRLDVLEAR
jgi:hypothetical protein